MASPYANLHFCGCWYVTPGQYSYPQKNYVPQVALSSHTTILATTSRTVLRQKFFNPSEKLDEVQYTFPLYDGVGVVGFRCAVAKRSIVGVVKEKQQARLEYTQAVERGQTAALLEQLPAASDAFTTRIGNVPPNEHILVEIVYLGELKHDAETDGVRFTIPTVIAPRYGSAPTDAANLPRNSSPASAEGGIRILVDVVVDEGSAIRGLQSPSHPIAMTTGRTSSMSEDAFANHCASATLTLGTAELDKDFIIVVLAKGQDAPRALLERHSAVAGHRALMATLVPKFSLPPILPEIVFVADRSGSMSDKIETLVSAMRIFLKSLPVGVKFNICSFGSDHTFLWPKSRSYDQSSLEVAVEHLDTFSANYGGTELLQPLKATVENRFKDMLLEVMVITDGQIWDQTQLFDFISEATTKSVRFFSLGVGAGASSSLVEGIARAGDGFAQFVGEHEKMDKRVVRMLRAALTPHIKNYTLEVQYDIDDEEFELVESATESMKGLVASSPPPSSVSAETVKSLFDPSTKETPTTSPAGRYDHLPAVATPKLLQAPHRIPPLYPFSRTTVYLLMSPESCQRAPKAVILRAASEHGPLELEIPVQAVGVGETIHQLAAKKAIQELEEGRGWITEAEDGDGRILKEKHEGRMEEMVEREAARLGVQFQVGGKWTSFVAVEAGSENDGEGQEWEINRTPMADTWVDGRAPPCYGGFGATNGVSDRRRRAKSSRSASTNTTKVQGTFGYLGGSSFGYQGSRAATGAETRLALACGTAATNVGSVGVAPSAVFGFPPAGQSASKQESALFFGAASDESDVPDGDNSPLDYAEDYAADEYPVTDWDQLLRSADCNNLLAEYDSEAPMSEEVKEKSGRQSQTDEDRMHALIALQGFDGSWKWEEQLFAMLGVDQAKLEAMFASVIGTADSDSAVKATMAAVAFLQGKVPAEVDVWEMVVEKAMGWLRRAASSQSCAEDVCKIQHLILQC